MQTWEQTYRSTGQWRFAAFTRVDTCGNQDGSGGSTGMTATLAALEVSALYSRVVRTRTTWEGKRTYLGTDDVHADVESLGNMLRVSNHLHISDQPPLPFYIPIHLPNSSRRRISGPYPIRDIRTERDVLTFIHKIPALCNLSTTSFGGTPTAHTNSLVFSSMMTSMRSLRLPLV